jgi:hypothetical protein
MNREMLSSLQMQEVHRSNVICWLLIRQVQRGGLYFFPLYRPLLGLYQASTTTVMAALIFPPSEAVVGQLHPVSAGPNRPRAIREAVRQRATRVQVLGR